MSDPTILGFKLQTITVLLLVLVILLLLLVFVIIHKLNIISRKYSALMSGKKGVDLEKIIRIRFKEMDQVKANARRVTREHKAIKFHQDTCINKIGLVKYDAFEEMAGNLSFSVAFLNSKNTGVVINSMHTREGCYTYAKEIINGESYIPLSDEEKEAISKAKTIEEEIDEMIKKTDTEDDVNFDI